MAEMKHMANKQMERHMNKAMGGGKEVEHDGASEHGHESFHVFKHAAGAHSVHHHMGGVEHADHASTDEAMDHGKMAMGGDSKPPMMGGMPAEEASEGENWA
jgi:hypothetical protein